MSPEQKDLIKRRMNVVQELIDKSIEELWDDRATEQAVMDSYWRFGDAKKSIEEGVTRLLN